MKKTLFFIFLLILFYSVSISSDMVKITGQVFDIEKKPLAGVIVNTKNSKVFAQSDNNGMFSLYSKNNDSVTVRKKSFETYRFQIDSKKKNYKITLSKVNRGSGSTSQKGENTPDIPHFEESTTVSLTGSADFTDDAIIISSVEGGGVSDRSRSLSAAHSIKTARGAFTDTDDRSFSRMSAEERMPSAAELKTFEDRFVNTNATSGKLTAGEVNDFSKWKLWSDIAYDSLKEHSYKWKIYPLNRYVLQLENTNGTPIIGAVATLLSGKNTLWNAITDNTGKSELWANPYSNQNYNENYSIIFEYNSKKYTIKSAKPFSEGINYYKINSNCAIPNQADIVFVIDATGSMQDEIDFLKADLLDIINKVKDTLPQMYLNLGCVFYKDTTDDYIAKYYDLNDKPENTIEFIKENNAGGGGDYPEAVHRAIDVAVNYLSWRDNTIAKIVFLVLDAPPHHDADKIAELQITIAKSAKKGIRIVPVACSGVDKSTEYILRTIALLTNGTYTFLTNHSGIGNAHIEPTTDKYEVEKLNDVIKRIIIQYTDAPPCSNQAIAGISDTGFVNTQLLLEENNSSENNKIEIKYYPNPTNRYLNIEVANSNGEIFIADVSGKLIKHIQLNGSSKIDVDLYEFPSGTYFVMYQYSPDLWAKGKFILIKS